MKTILFLTLLFTATFAAEVTKEEGVVVGTEDNFD